MADQTNPYELPRTVYCVHYLGSVTSICSSVLHARDKSALLASVHAKFLNHLDRECREPSPFISLFSDLARARAFAEDLREKCEKRGKREGSRD
jgi:hypothetical protein